jgi:urea transport system permease protein
MTTLRALRLVLLALPFLLISMHTAKAQETDIPALVQAMGEASLRELGQIVTDLAATGDSA